ncbi:MAG TPA: DivIVA domain-containing protein [Kocuria rosea]|nr:DivIVA domain-containing protein [Kocuria rosea]
MTPEPSAEVPPPGRFPRCGAAQWGYAADQVDALLAAVHARLAGPPPAGGPAATPARDPAEAGSRHVRTAVFDRARGGYRPGAVDEALDAAEDALAALERDLFLGAHGAEAWHQYLDGLAALLRGRLERPRTRRFRRPSRARARGYSAAHVDVLCERLAEHLEGGETLEPSALRRAVFPSAHGERGYEEQQVDAFLDRAVELLLALR